MSSEQKQQIPFVEHQRDGPQLDHASRGHALLTASGSHRWMHCTPSARLEAQFPNESSIYAEQGTAVHEFCEYLVRKDLHERVQMPQSEFYTEEALNNAEIYREFVAENVEKVRSEGLIPMVLVEERLDFSNIVPEGFGTGDCLILAPGKLHIIDYKNGHHMVDAHRNNQMMLYALGALNMYDYLFNVQEVSMSIVQPRVENISTYLPEKKTVSQFDLKGRFARQYLSFAGKSSKDFLLYLSGPGVYDSPAADVESTSVPGRNGDIISENARAGRRRYQNVDIKYEAFFFNGLPAKTAAVKSWLLSPVGYQKLQDTYDQDFFRMAVCTEAMEFDVTAQKAAKMDLVFNCKPQRWSVEGQRTVRLESRSNLMNPFAFPAQPIFKIYGDSGGVLYVGDESIIIRTHSFILVYVRDKYWYV